MIETEFAKGLQAVIDTMRRLINQNETPKNKKKVNQSFLSQ